MHLGQSVGPAFVGGETTCGLGAAGHRLGGRLRIEEADLAGRLTVAAWFGGGCSCNQSPRWIGLTSPLRV
jgi:hypothetical protein